MNRLWLLLSLLAVPLSAQVDTLRGTVGKDTLKVGFTSSVRGCSYAGRFAVAGDTARTVLEHRVLCWDTVASPVVVPPPVVTPPTGTVAWNSDWRTGTILDGKWSGISGGSTTNLSVIPAVGMGFPSDMTNVLRVNVPANTISQMLMTNGKWPTPPIDGTVYYRVYHRSAFPNNFANGGFHPFQNGLNNLAWEWKTGVVANGQVTLQFWLNGSQDHYPYTHFDISGGYLSNHTYRIEWAITRKATGVVGQWGTVTNPGRVQIRIYDESISKTVPAFTNDSFHQMDATTTLTADSAKYYFSLSPSVDESFSAINLGNNGPQVDSRTGNNYEYYGGFAVCTSWCGAYTAAGH